MQRRVVDGGSGFASQNDRRPHFGLGKREWVDRVVDRVAVGRAPGTRAPADRPHRHHHRAGSMSDATPATASATTARRSRSRFWQRTSRIDPRYLIAGLVTLVLLVAQFRYHMVGGYSGSRSRSASAWRRKRCSPGSTAAASSTCRAPTSAASASPCSPSRREARSGRSSSAASSRSRPSTCCATATSTSGTRPTSPSARCCSPRRARSSVLSHQFGNDLVTNLVIWIFGLIIAKRVGVLHITLSYVASFLVLNGRARAGARPAALPRARADHRPDVSAVRLLHDHRPAHRREGAAEADGRRRDHRPRRDADPPHVRPRRADADRLQRRSRRCSRSRSSARSRSASTCDGRPARAVEPVPLLEQELPRLRVVAVSGSSQPSVSASRS